MSLRIIKAGVLDTIQDAGRFGHQHLGINPGGCMDLYAAQLGLSITGCAGTALIELHFPASIFLFEQEAMITITGADFTPTIDGDEISLNRPVIVARNSLLQFEKRKRGARAYLAIREGIAIDRWLGSRSTNTKAKTGGFNGRALQRDDVINYASTSSYHLHCDMKPLSWTADPSWLPREPASIDILAGPEWHHLAAHAKHDLTYEKFLIAGAADRMGYLLNGPFQAGRFRERVSSAVTFGTLQLLPSGQPILLMADHQTTGGYPRIAQVITAHLPFVAQKQTGDSLRFRMVGREVAWNTWLQQYRHLQQVNLACHLKLESLDYCGRH